MKEEGREREEMNDRRSSSRCGKDGNNGRITG